MWYISKLAAGSLFSSAVLAFFVWSCVDHDLNGPPELSHAVEADFQDSANVSVQLSEGFKLSLWAPGPLLANAIAISLDYTGAAYVTETQRRKSSDLDIREHRNWMTEDLALNNLEDTRNLLLEKLATEKSEQNTWMEDFNGDGLRDWRDLTVQSERVRKIWDSDEDGKADISSVFFSDTNELLSGVAAGVLYHDHSVYLTTAPHLYRMQDMDGDGDADNHEQIISGFGIHIAYAGHDMSGLTLGPDGKIYWSIGDMGVNATDKNGNNFAYPHEGAVMRCNPDGTEFEVYAHGLRNTQELAFDSYGNLISVDNDGDHPGEHERFVHILEGSDSGWRIYWQFGKYDQPNEEYKVWMDEKLHLPHFKGQAAYILPPLALAPDGPAGLVYQPGSALNQQWENFFFSSYFKGSSAQSKIQAFRLEPKGASFKVVETKDILTGIVSTGLAFGPDGALYLNDWLEGYEKKPAGRIWKLDVAQQNEETRNKTKNLLKEGMKRKSISELQELLGYGDMRVRMLAQFEIVHRNQPQALLAVLENENLEIAQVHAVWGLGQLARFDPGVGQTLVPFLSVDNPEIKTQTAKVLGDASFQEAADRLLELLDDESDRVKYFAAEALGKMEEKRAFHPIVALIEETQDSDPHLRHGLTYALSRLDMEQELVELSSHSSIDVRLAAIVTLRRLRSPGLREFLKDKDTLVLKEAARAIHDDQSVPQALPDLAEALLNTDISSEVFIRRSINANLRLGDAASAERLTKYASNTLAPKAMRMDALWALGYWKQPPELDRVEGRYRKLGEHSLQDAQLVFSKVASELLNSQDPSLKSAVIAAVGRLKYSDAEDQLVGYCLQTTQPLEVRRSALQSLAELESQSMEKVLNACLMADQVELRTDAQSLLGTLDLPAETVVWLLAQVLKNSTIPEKQQALNSLGKINDPAARDLLETWLDSLVDGTLDARLQLDLITAVSNSSFSGLKDKLETFEAQRAAASPLQRYQETLSGGNPENGRRLFFQNNSAQCARCHQLGEYGGEVGPDLNHIAAVLDRESLLEAMIDPSARLAPGYGTISLELENGNKVVGVLESESGDSLQVKISDGSSSAYALNEIKNKTYVPSSMPSMQGVLNKKEIRDLMAYLMEQL